MNPNPKAKGARLILLLALATIFPVQSWADNVTYNAANLAQIGLSPVTATKLEIHPRFPYERYGTNIITRRKITVQFTDGTVTVSNMVAGVYTNTIKDSKDETVFLIEVAESGTDNNVFAHELLEVSTNAPGSAVAYSKVVSDSRFLNTNDIIAGDNITVTPTNSGTKLIISSTGGGGSGATNAVTSFNGLSNVVAFVVATNQGSAFNYVLTTNGQTLTATMTINTNLATPAEVAAVGLAVTNSYLAMGTAITNAYQAAIAALGTTVTNVFQTQAASATLSNNLVSAIQGTNTHLQNQITTNRTDISAVTNALGQGRAIYVAPWGNDTTADGSILKPFKTVHDSLELSEGTYRGARTVATAGDAIVLTPDIHLLGVIVLPDNVHLWIQPGAKVVRSQFTNLTIFGSPTTNTPALTTIGPLIQPGNNSIVDYRGATLIATNDSGDGYDGAIGWLDSLDTGGFISNYGFTSTPKTNVTIYAGHGIGTTDFFYFVQTNETASSVTIHGGTTRTGWDAGRAAGNITVSTFGLDMFATNLNHASLGESRAMAISGGAIWNDVGSLLGSGGGTNFNNPVWADDSTVTLSGTKLYRTSTNGADIYLTNGAAWSGFYNGTSGSVSSTNVSGANAVVSSNFTTLSQLLAFGTAGTNYTDSLGAYLEGLVINKLSSPTNSGSDGQILSKTGSDTKWVDDATGGSGSGESNTISSASTLSGAMTIVAGTPKVGVDLRVKSIYFDTVDFTATENTTNISVTLNSTNFYDSMTATLPVLISTNGGTNLNIELSGNLTNWSKLSTNLLSTGGGSVLTNLFLETSSIETVHAFNELTVLVDVDAKMVEGFLHISGDDGSGTNYCSIILHIDLTRPDEGEPSLSICQFQGAMVGVAPEVHALISDSDTNIVLLTASGYPLSVRGFGTNMPTLQTNVVSSLPTHLGNYKTKVTTVNGQIMANSLQARQFWLFDSDGERLQFISLINPADKNEGALLQVEQSQAVMAYMTNANVHEKISFGVPETGFEGTEPHIFRDSSGWDLEIFTGTGTLKLNPSGDMTINGATALSITNSWEDANGNTHEQIFTKGILTGYTLTPP